MNKRQHNTQRVISILPFGLLFGLLFGAALGFCPANPAMAQGVQRDPLPSWNDGAAKRGILNFVARVTEEGGPDFIPVADRIATFDNDGTLWAEKPLPVEVYFTLDRVKELAAKDPTLKER